MKYACLLTALCCTSIAMAEDVPTRQEFNSLEQRVEQLEHSLHLQSSAVKSPATATTASTNHADSQNQWAILKSGMSQQDVLNTLGEPTRRIQLNGQVMWYYTTEHGNGSVIFNHSGQMDQFQKPPFNALTW